MHVHDHNDTGSSRRIGLVFFLNLSFTVIEFIGGVLTNSTAIMADAVHDLGDSVSIGGAWLLDRLSKRSPDDYFTYGYRRLSLLGALINGLVLVAGSIWVLSEAVPRLADPVMPVTEGMVALALLGVSVNGVAAYRLSKGRTLNEKVLNWHLLEDVLGWVAVLVVSVILMFTDWPILDPLLSVAFTLFILMNVMQNLWATGKLFVQAAPNKTLTNKVRKILLNIEGVRDIHHQHLWSLDGEHHVLTAHVVVEHQGRFDPEFYSDIKRSISNSLEGLQLSHTTIEIELEKETCRDESR